MHVIGPFENRVVLCNVSKGFFKSFGRPSKAVVYADLISAVEKLNIFVL